MSIKEMRAERTKKESLFIVGSDLKLRREAAANAPLRLSPVCVEP
jgi:hypothetical protein